MVLESNVWQGMRYSDYGMLCLGDTCLCLGGCTYK